MIAGAPSPIAAVAGFALDVAQAARDGDRAARTIWHRAAGYIGGAVAAAARRAHLKAPVEYALTGGISGDIDVLEPALTDYLLRHLGQTSRLNPLGNSLDGADALLSMTAIGSLGELARATNPTKGLRE